MLILSMTGLSVFLTRGTCYWYEMSIELRVFNLVLAFAVQGMQLVTELDRDLQLTSIICKVIPIQ